MRGGLKFTIENGVEGCSTAFSAVSGTGRYVLSAAHCSGTVRRNGGSKYGDVENELKSSYVDAERIRRTNSNWTEAGRVWVSSSDQRAVKAYITWDNVVVGKRVLKSGHKLNTTYGDIKGKYYSPSYVPNSDRFITATYCSAGGDSGGSVMRSNTAYGIHSGRNKACGESGSFGVFGSIGYAMGAMDVGLIAG